MADIFISYSQQDRQRVKPLVDALTAEGYQVWWDLEIRAGEPFDELIESTLKKVQCVITVWSQHSVASEWVRAESAWAKDRGKVVSIRIDDGIELPIKFYNVHTPSLVGWTGARDATAFQVLLADIAKIAGPPSTPEPDLPSTPEPKPVSNAAQDRPADTPKIADSPSPPLDPSLSSEPKPVPDAPQDPPADTPEIADSSSSPPDLSSAPEPKPVPTPPQDLPADTPKIVDSSSPPPDPSPPSDPAPVLKQPVSSRRWIGVVGLIVVFVGVLAGGISFILEKDKPLILRDTLEDGSRGPAMVVIPGGSFQMGSPATEPERSDDEGPVHRVTLDSFAMGRTEVTFAEYDRFAAARGRKKPNDEDWGRGEQPVINVSWDDATAYVDWLSDQTGERYRLPTEAEWEYAARAGTRTPFWTGDCIHTDQANYDGENYDYNDCGAKTGVYRGQTVPAGSLPANPWGLHEIAGNIWEWTQDCWHKNYRGAPSDGSAWSQGNGGDCTRRVARGGGWFNHPRNLRSADRIWITTDDAFDDLGFRLAREL
ncbi:SUMF1/EgtB/PvdO family nonheme iron enzyme [Candidatus Thiosymbion oneisti]|uniref:SUMF1/EgtB/PvdO family nonheme iron enzyme n=1 Tax=Candidatus Thiosymbion oneisti TaxID=589554 RepID=UPI000B7EE8E3|nr:SUMF1/EgtB/PvdO family nonheme iron enzyme [Candidatus Thiosymbion oneisti]